MKKISVLVALLFVFASQMLWGNTPSGSKEKTEGFERVVVNSGFNLPLHDSQSDFLGYVNDAVVLYNGTTQQLSYVKSGAEAKSIGNFNVAGVYQADGAVVLRDSLNNIGILVDNGGELKLEGMPAFPNGGEIVGLAKKDNTVYAAAIAGGNMVVYSMPKGTQAWGEMMSVPAAKSYDVVFAFQSNGADQCMWVFMQDGKIEQIYEYNLRLKKHSEVAVPVSVVPDEEFDMAVARGAGHIVLLNSNKNILNLYHTVTNTFCKFDIPEQESEIQILQRVVSNNEIKEVAFDNQALKFFVNTLVFEKTKSGFTVVDTIVIILYFLALLMIGVYFSKRQKNQDDYFKGGERIPWWAAGLSLFGTALSAITFMAIPAKAFATDWSYMLFNVGIVLVAPIIMFIFIPFFRKLNITTAYQYLEVRFNALIRVICSVAFIVFQVGRMGVVLFLPSIAIHLVTGVNIFLCIGVMGIFSILYTRMGGIEAVVWTDALQVVILLGGALFSIFHIVSHTGLGFGETFSIAIADGKLSFGDTAFDLTNASMWTTLIATFFTNLTTYGTDQSMVQRYLTTGSQKEAQKSVLTNALLTIPATIIFFLIGTVLYVYFKTIPENMSVTMENTDAVFPWYIYSQLPVGLTGLLISGIFAAAMSTLSGSMNSAATAYIIDIRPKLFPKKAEASLQEAKATTLVIGTMSLLFAFLMATWNINSLWDEFNKILGLILGSMGGLFMLGMVTKRANSAGALIGMIVSIIVQALVAAYTPVHLLLYTSVGFVTCFVVGYIASFLFPAKK